MFSFKNIFVPKTNEVKQVETVQLWIVKWWSLRKDIINTFRPTTTIEAFTSEAEAEEFYQSLKAAMKLLKNDWQNVTIEKN